MNPIIKATLLTGALVAPISAWAAIIKTNTFLTAPENTLTFTEQGLPANTVVTNQYNGVSFSPNLVQSPQNMSIFSNNGDANNLGNFSPVIDPFFIVFDQAVDEAAFAYVTNQGNSRFRTFLNNVLVDDVTLDTTFNQAAGNDIYQFSSIFDTIRVDVGGSNSSMLMDNLQWSAVPEPASLGMLGLGLVVLGRIGRRKAA